MSVPDIKYSAIFQGNILKAEAGDRNGLDARNNYRGAALSIAAQATPGDVACVTTNNFVGYYIQRRDNIVIVAIGKEGASPRVLLSFLKRIDDSLKGSSDFQVVLNSASQYTEENRDSLQLAQNELSKVKQIMVENIDRLLERGERVNLLMDRTGEMSEAANIFSRQATQLQRKFWYQNIKFLAFGALLFTGSCFAGATIWGHNLF